MLSSGKRNTPEEHKKESSSRDPLDAEKVSSHSNLELDKLNQQITDLKKQNEELLVRIFLKYSNKKGHC